jgi:hypothetical protein
MPNPQDLQPSAAPPQEVAANPAQIESSQMPNPQDPQPSAALVAAASQEVSANPAQSESSQTPNSQDPQPSETPPAVAANEVSANPAQIETTQTPNPPGVLPPEQTPAFTPTDLPIEHASPDCSSLPDHLAKGLASHPNPIAGCCWVTPEYLVWTIKRGPVPLPVVSSGALTDMGTVVQFGNTVLDYRDFSGGRLTVGTWFDDYGTIGIEAEGFLFQRRTLGLSFSSDNTGRPPLGIPFFNADTMQEDFADFAIPDELVGRIDVTSTSQLWGAESNFLFNLYRGESLELALLAGFRYLGLKEDLTNTGSSAALEGQQVFFGGEAFNPPAITTTTDRFTTHNHFFGCQIGIWTEYRYGGTFVDVGGKVAIGATHEVVEVSGTSALFIGPGAPVQTLPGGLFALPSNIGRTSNDDFAVVPEVQVKVGYHLTKHWSVFAGYSFMYWSRVVRPGDQINRILTPEQIPTFAEFVPSQAGAGQPFPVFRTTDFWAQGVNFGMEFCY